MHPKAAEMIMSPGASRLWQGAWRLARGFGPRRLRFFHQVDDPHSQLLLGTIRELRARFDVQVDLRIVPPPTAEHDPDPERARAFALRDAREMCRFYEVELPEPGPRSPADVRAAQVRLLALQSAEDGIEESEKVGAALWRGEAISDPGGDPAPGLKRAQDELHRTGYYRGGTLFYDGEHYPGIGRLPFLVARLAREAGGNTDSIVARRDAPEPPVAPAPAPRVLEWFYSFRSPYSYLSVDLVADLVRRHEVDLRIRPVLPMVMRGLAVPLRKRLYLVRDAKRIADTRGLPFGRFADPVGEGVERLLAVFAHVDPRHQLDFLAAAGRAVWGQGVSMVKGPGLARLADDVGLSESYVRAALLDESWRQVVEDNRSALLARGLWGVPSFVLGDFSTWGQDRMFALEARLQG